MVDTTATEENNHNTLTVPGHQLEGLLRAAMVQVALAEATAAPAAAMVAAEAAWRELLTQCWKESWWRR
jgi:hypothetical protein